MLYVAAVVIALVLGVVWWRYTSVARGVEQRNRRLLKELEPLGIALATKQPVSASEVAKYASRPELRVLLRQVLQKADKLAMFPEEYDSTVAEGEALLCFWMMHPNELGQAPAEIRLEESCRREIDARMNDFHVFGYRMPAGHWAGDDWRLGVTGPFVAGEPPYAGTAGAFSRVADIADKVSPGAAVDWYVGLVFAKRQS